MEAEVIEGTALVVRESAAPAPVVGWTPSFAVAVDDAIERKREKNRFFREVMDKDLHYGVIPGTGTKPTLLKPGAEMLLANMGLNPELSDAEPPVIDVTGRDHNGEPYIHYRRVCRIYRQVGLREDERMLVARAEGSCSSWETKYRYRNDQRKCPQCGKPAIIAGKKEYGGGFICFKKKDGCGAKFADNDPAIVGQAVGKVANPDIAEIENTILKMADKRALVAATLLATGCSDIFTQDVEDMAVFEPPAAEPEPPAPTGPTPTDLLLDRAAAIGIIPEEGDFDARLAALKAYAKKVNVKITVAAMNAHLDGLEASEAASRAAEAQERPKTTCVGPGGCGGPHTEKQHARFFSATRRAKLTDPERYALMAEVGAPPSTTKCTGAQLDAVVARLEAGAA